MSDRDHLVCSPAVPDDIDGGEWIEALARCADVLEALVADFRQRNPGIEFDNAAVAGGAGTIARTVLATRLENDDPPDSYQAHAGLELDSDIAAGYVEDIR